ncbi:MAG: WbuC family cupin fold metalloprotein [Chitinivibrionales bacterium]|nr:WbuC family cupin fold metalloprotein [Chitinivibrionales bacterium]
MKEFTDLLISQLFEAAQKSPRKRANHNFHDHLSDPIQRMGVVALETTYIRPHLHEEQGKWEIFIILEGDAEVLLFDEQGTVTDKRHLSANPKTGSRLIEIPPLAWHTLVICSPRAVLVELKPGPYVPTSDKGFASWAPAEASPGAAAFETTMRNSHRGQKLR